MREERDGGKGQEKGGGSEGTNHLLTPWSPRVNINLWVGQVKIINLTRSSKILKREKKCTKLCSPYFFNLE